MRLERGRRERDCESETCVRAAKRSRVARSSVGVRPLVPPPAVGHVFDYCTLVRPSSSWGWRPLTRVTTTTSRGKHQCSDWGLGRTGQSVAGDTPSTCRASSRSSTRSQSTPTPGKGAVELGSGSTDILELAVRSIAILGVSERVTVSRD